MLTTEASGTLQAPTVEEFEAITGIAGYDEVLSVFPESYGDLSLEQVIEAREQIVNTLVRSGLTTREQIDSGESHARETGTVMNNAELLQEGAYETKAGVVTFSDRSIQQTFNNWLTRIGEATGISGDDYRVVQNVGDEPQIQTAIGGSIDMMVRGLDMNIALAKKDPRFLAEAQRALPELRTEVVVTQLAKAHPDEEYVVFESSPHAHKLVSEAGADFAKQRNYSVEDRVAMHRSHMIGNGRRSMLTTQIEDDSMELWDKVYGDEINSDADRLGALVIVNVTNRNFSHEEIHVLSIANIDQAQSELKGELTHAGASIGTAEERQDLYDKAIEKSNEKETRAIDQAQSLTQLSIQIAESIITGTVAPEVAEGLSKALDARTSDGRPLLEDKQLQLFRTAIARGKLDQQTASELQELMVFQESAQSTDELARLTSLLGAERAADVVAKKDIKQVARDAFAAGQRAGGCPGADCVIEEKHPEIKFRKKRGGEFWAEPEEQSKNNLNLLLGIDFGSTLERAESIAAVHAVQYHEILLAIEVAELLDQLRGNEIAETRKSLRLGIESDQNTINTLIGMLGLTMADPENAVSKKLGTEPEKLLNILQLLGRTSDSTREWKSESNYKTRLEYLFTSSETTRQKKDKYAEIERIREALILMNKLTEESSELTQIERDLIAERERKAIRLLEELGVTTNSGDTEKIIISELKPEQITEALAILAQRTDQSPSSNLQEKDELLENYVLLIEILIGFAEQAEETHKAELLLLVKNRIESSSSGVKEVIKNLDIIISLADSDIKLEEGLKQSIKDFLGDSRLTSEFTDDPGEVKTLLEMLNNPEKFSAKIDEILKNMRELSKQLTVDLLEGEVSDEVEQLMIQILQMSATESELLFTSEDLEVIESSLQNRVLAKEALFIIRRFVLYQQLKELIPSEKIRIKFVCSAQVLSMLQMVTNDHSVEILELSGDRLVRSGVFVAADDHEEIIIRLGVFAVAGWRLDPSNRKSVSQVKS